MSDPRTLHVWRYDRERDVQPFLQRYESDVERDDRMLSDVLSVDMTDFFNQDHSIRPYLINDTTPSARERLTKAILEVRTMLVTRSV